MTALQIAQGDQGKMGVVFWMGGLSMEGSLVNIRAYKPYLYLSGTYCHGTSIDPLAVQAP